MSGDDFHRRAYLNDLTERLRAYTATWAEVYLGPYIGATPRQINEELVRVFGPAETLDLPTTCLRLAYVIEAVYRGRMSVGDRLLEANGSIIAARPETVDEIRRFSPEVSEIAAEAHRYKTGRKFNIALSKQFGPIATLGPSDLFLRTLAALEMVADPKWGKTRSNNANARGKSPAWRAAHEQYLAAVDEVMKRRGLQRGEINSTMAAARGSVYDETPLTLPQRTAALYQMYL